MSIQAVDPLTVLYSILTPAEFYRYTIQDNSGTYTISGYGNTGLDPAAKASATLTETTSTYLYVGGHIGYCYFYKFDHQAATLGAASVVSSLIASLSYSKILATIPSLDSTFMACGEYTFCLQVNKATMQEVTRV